MKRILIIVLVLVVIAVAAGIFFLVWGKGGGAGSNAGPGVSPVGLPTVPSAASSSALAAAGAAGPLPADAPQGDTFMLQAASGTVTVRNFYKTGLGYYPDTDTVMLEKNASYTIWYYRSTSHFDIWFSPGAGTAADEAAAARALEGDLGIDQKSLCMLSAGEVFQVDRGITNETGPLEVCSSGAFQ